MVTIHGQSVGMAPFLGVFAFSCFSNKQDRSNPPISIIALINFYQYFGIDGEVPFDINNFYKRKRGKGNEKEIIG